MVTKSVQSTLLDDEIMVPNGGGTVKKVDAYDWKTIDKPGRFTNLDKRRISIDHAYQRDSVVEARVNRIAAELSWVKFGTITVIRRQDGTYWCIDGQHRLLAALKRSDIPRVPCMVFNAFSRVQEAEGFLGINMDRGAVKMFDKFNGLMAANDPVAVAMKEMVEGSGYKIAKGAANKTVQCVGAIYSAVDADERAAYVAWKLCVDLYAGQQPLDRVFLGLFTLERALKKRDATRSLDDVDNRKILLKAGSIAIDKSIRDLSAGLGIGGRRAYGAGVAKLINEKRRSGKVPSLLAGTDHE